MEKITLTQAQANRIEYIKTKGNVIGAIRTHLTRNWNNEINKCLNTLDDEQFIKAVWEDHSYEVEPEYKVDDWAKFHHYSDEWIAIIEDVYTTTEGEVLCLPDEDIHVMPGGRHYTVTQATPEEIKAEQERRVWAKIGREVGEFREGDIGVAKHMTYSNLDNIKWAYASGCLKGFYPAESFISFGGDE